MIIPHNQPAADTKLAAWMAAGKTLASHKTLTTLCTRSDCAEPAHQLPWARGKAVPAAVRGSFLRTLMRKASTTPDDQSTELEPEPIEIDFAIEGD